MKDGLKSIPKRICSSIKNRIPIISLKVFAGIRHINKAVPIGRARWSVGRRNRLSYDEIQDQNGDRTNTPVMQDRQWRFCVYSGELSLANKL